jgi:C-terminal AAA-associated domain
MSTSPVLLFASKGQVEIPQADEVDRIIALVRLVGKGVRNAKAIAEALRFDVRQSSYYREAAEILGLLDPAEVYTLTELGRRFVASDELTSTKLMVCALLNYPIVAQIASILQSRLVTSVHKNDIELLISQESEVHGTTVQRRAQTIIAWLKWLHESSHVIAVEGDVVRLEAQQRIF